MEGIPPTFAQRPQTKSAEVGTSAELECRFVAIPEAEVQWFHNKNLLPPNDARVSIMHQVRQILCKNLLQMLVLRSFTYVNNQKLYRH